MPCTLEAALAAPYCAKVLDDHGVPVNVPNQAEGMVFPILVLDFLQQTHRGHSQHSLEFPTICLIGQRQRPATLLIFLFAEPRALRHT